MPRKKTSVDTSEIAPPIPATEPVAKSPRGRRKATETVTEPVVSVEAAAKPARSRRKATPVEPSPEPVVAVEAVPDPEPAPKRGRIKAASTPEKSPVAAPRRRRKAEPEPIDTPTVEAVDPNFDWASSELPEPIWRSRTQVIGDSTKPVSAASADTDEDSDDDASSEEGGASSEDGDDKGDRRRRRRRRRRSGGRRVEDAAEAATTNPAPTIATVAEAEPTPITAPVATPVVPVAPLVAKPEAPRPEPVRRERVAPKAPEKAAIAVPEDGPQVVVRNGIPTLVRKTRVYPPILFFGSPADERRADTVIEQLRMASEAGIHVHSFLIEFEVDPSTIDESASIAAFMLSKAVSVDPDSQVLFRISFSAPRGWEERYPDARFKDAEGHLAEPSLCDEQFWTVARQCLETFVRKLRLLDLRDHILGLHLERGEWFLPLGHGYDTSRAAQRRFRDWARQRYVDDEVTLRASWFDGTVRFDTIQIPTYNPEGSEGEKFIRSSRKQRRYVDYHLFLSDATVQRIGDLAYAAKAASDGYFLIGVSYGYTFEWSHPDSGHLSLGKLLRTPEIDFIAGPPSYRGREPGGSAPFPGPIDSFALNGKLYLSEEDYKTSLSQGHEPDDFNPRLKTPQALDSVHWRGVGTALAHASGVAWMDLWGNGWLKTHSVWERAKQVRDAMIDRMAAPLGDPEVAVFIDERALAYLVDTHAFALLVQNVRESLLRAGVSAGFYLLSDLAHREKFPESKLYLFLNAWDIRPELRSAIKSRLQRNDKVLFWLYAAGLFDAGRDSLERAREVTGIALKPQPYYSKSGTTILNRRHPLSEAFPDRNVVAGSTLEPTYFAIPEEAMVLGEYTQTGLPSFVVRRFEEGPADTHWTSVFLGEPMVNAALIRALAQMAGAHVWNFQEDVVHVRPPFCTVHCTTAGPRTITLPGKYSAYNLLTNEWAAIDSQNLRFTAIDGSTHCFLVGTKDELEALLRTEPADLLRIDHLPPRETNIRVDAANFDVPIMRLDEWIDQSDGDDNADEWFLRPAPVAEEVPTPAVETPDRVGRRRRRRRGNGRPGDREAGDGIGSDEISTARREPSGSPESGDDGLGLNVVFRKRE